MGAACTCTQSASAVRQLRCASVCVCVCEMLIGKWRNVYLCVCVVLLLCRVWLPYINLDVMQRLCAELVYIEWVFFGWSLHLVFMSTCTTTTTLSGTLILLIHTQTHTQPVSRFCIQNVHVVDGSKDVKALESVYVCECAPSATCAQHMVQMSCPLYGRAGGIIDFQSELRALLFSFVCVCAE